MHKKSPPNMVDLNTTLSIVLTALWLGSDRQFTLGFSYETAGIDSECDHLQQGTNVAGR